MYVTAAVPQAIGDLKIQVGSGRVSWGECEMLSQSLPTCPEGTHGLRKTGL
jgi:hypothetical protein